jgi:enoyl-CoA hydratase/3-hydroxyacyl-CoA dehydrogenase
MNALNEAVVAQLGRRFAEAEADPRVKAIVFQGSGKAFVAGADIRYFIEKIKENHIQDIVEFTRKGHNLFLRIEDSKKLTIALLDALSLGGGSELALACQAIIATAAGSMAFPETGIGIYPGLGGMLRLTRHVGPELAKYFAFTGAPLNAADAQALGIITRLVSPTEVDATIHALMAEGRPEKYRTRQIPEKFKPFVELFAKGCITALLSGKTPNGVSVELAGQVAKALGNKAPLALRIADEIIDRQAGLPMRAAVEIELDRLKDIFATEDALEGLSSLGRRRPEFKGK